MNRYMAKLNSEQLPGNDPAGWEQGEIDVPKDSPRRVRDPKRSGLPQIAPGDEIWICTDVDGPGIAASADVGEVTKQDGKLRIRLRRVRIIDEPIPLNSFGRLKSGSAVFSQLQRNRHPELYHLNDDDFAEFKEVILDRLGPDSLPVRPSWAEVIERNDREAQSQMEAALDVPLALRPVRPGQKAFRDALMGAYDGTCAITGCTVRPVLEAAHVYPWTGDPELDQLENGLLLRRDIHGLFDANLLTIDPESNRILLHPSLDGTEYAELDGRQVQHHAAPEFLAARAELIRSARFRD